MKTRIPSFFGLMFIFLTSAANAQETFALWEKGQQPFYKENTLVEYEKEAWGTTCVMNITEPTLTVYPAIGENTGKAVIVIPGGGYEMVAMYHEGYEIAKILSKQGITAAVLKYRLPNPASSDHPHLTPMTDGKRALQILREKASKYGIKNDQIGVLGFSAGSHLATVLSLWKSEDPTENPNFSALIYGVTDLSEENLEWLEKSLYHRPLTPTEIEKNTLLNHVSPSTPPTFMVHANDDDVCDIKETLLYDAKLREHNVMSEVHIFPKGGHGFGKGRVSDGTFQWTSLFVNWLKNH